MSAFDDVIDQGHVATGDIRVVLSPAYFFDFNGYPIYLWRGQGRLFAENGMVFLGTVDTNGTDHLQAPDFNDGRDGASAKLSFGLPYIDRQTYLALRDERWRVNGRKISRYMVVWKPGEGLRPSTPIDFDAHFFMQSVSFEEKMVQGPGMTMVAQYKATVTAKNGNAGRSQARRGTYTPTGQRERAEEMFGIVGDKGCDFIPELANKTFIRP